MANRKTHKEEFNFCTRNEALLWPLNRIWLIKTTSIKDSVITTKKNKKLVKKFKINTLTWGGILLHL